MRKSVAGVIAGLILFIPMAGAQFARQEIVTIQSITISDDDLLQGKTDGKPVTIAGRLLLPKATPDAKQPGVILIHGSGGIGGTTGSVAEWERELTSAGFAVFTLDSFTGRGIVSTVADQSQLAATTRSSMRIARSTSWRSIAISMRPKSPSWDFPVAASRARTPTWSASGSRTARRIGSSQPTLACTPTAAGLSKTTTR